MMADKGLYGGLICLCILHPATEEPVYRWQGARLTDWPGFTPMPASGRSNTRQSPFARQKRQSAP